MFDFIDEYHSIITSVPATFGKSDYYKNRLILEEK